MSVSTRGRAGRYRTARDLECYAGSDGATLASGQARLCLRHGDWRGFLHWQSVRVTMGRRMPVAPRWRPTLLALVLVALPLS